jgi:phosphate transport system permease protein
VGIVYVLLSQALPFFGQVNLKEFFTGRDWRPTPEPGTYGVLPLVTGTMMITFGAGLIALPLGLLSAIYLAEYARPKVRAVLKPALELLAGIPTVVYGYFGLFVVTPALKNIFPSIQTSNALAGAIVVGVMILPLVSSLCEDAISSVPKALREGAQGLGATKAETISKIVVPAAFSGVIASFILALSRALGETMAVTLAAGSNPVISLDPTKGIQTAKSCRTFPAITQRHRLLALMQIKPAQRRAHTVRHSLWINHFFRQRQIGHNHRNIAHGQNIMRGDKNRAAADLNRILRRAHHCCANALIRLFNRRAPSLNAALNGFGKARA